MEEESDEPLLLRPDSELTARILAGTCTAKANADLASVALELVQELKSRRRAGASTLLASVRTTASHVWNTRADRLAARGLRGVTSSTKSSRWAD